MICRNAIVLDVERRPGNALNIEIGAPVPRCPSKRPVHWPESASALRWLASGGSALVFGACDGGCEVAP